MCFTGYTSELDTCYVLFGITFPIGTLLILQDPGTHEHLQAAFPATSA